MGIEKTPGLDEVRVQDKETKLVRTMNRRAYELKPNRYILLKDGQKTEQEVAAEEKQELADLREENATLKQELADLRHKIQAADPEDAETENETVAPAEGEATEQDAPRRRGPKPKIVE